MDTSNKKVLILGHKGMLGSTVLNFFNNKKILTETINERWPSDIFKNKIKQSDSDIVINCIGSIPQKTKNTIDFTTNNLYLPVFLVKNFNNRIIHIASDAESQITDNSEYITSKKKATNLLSLSNKVHIIQTSIIGPEENTNKCIWSWLQNNTNEKINGYINHYWNGITTLEYSKICFNILTEKIKNNFLKVGTNCISKYNLLNILNSKLNLNKIIVPVLSDVNKNNCVVEINYKSQSIDKQIEEFLCFLQKNKNIF